MKRYIVIGPQRSGTTVVHISLKGHPNICAANDEIRIAPLFTQGMAAFTVSGDRYLSRTEKKCHVGSLFDAVTTSEANEQTLASGMKVATSSPSDARDFVEALQAHLAETIVILTRRRDLVAQFGSVLRRRATGQAHSWQSNKLSGEFVTTIASEKFIDYAKAILEVQFELEKLKVTHEVVELVYEEDILPPGFRGYYRVIEALGLPMLDPTWVTSKKIASEPAEFILNYQELVEVFARVSEEFSSLR